MVKQMLVLCAVLLSPLSVQAEVRTSGNFKMQADGLASAANMDSSNFKLFGIAGDGRAVKLSSSSHFKIGSSLVYVIGNTAGIADQGFCFPILTQNEKVAIICL